MTIDIRQFFTEQTIKNYTYLDGTSTVLDIALLKSLAKNIENCRYLEIGTHRGESLTNVAEVSDGFVSISKEYDDRIKDILPDKLATRGIQVKVDSTKIDFRDIPDRFDLIFIDGSHRYADVVSDTRNAFKVLEKGGIIVWHDYGLTAETVNYEVLAAIYAGCPSVFEAMSVYHVSNTLCAIYGCLPSNDHSKLFQVSVSTM